MRICNTKAKLRSLAMAAMVLVSLAVGTGLITAGAREGKEAVPFEQVTLTSSDTVIAKTYEAEETLDSWWDSTFASRRKLVITEPGLMDRDNDPVNVYVEFSGNDAQENSIRIAYFNNSGAWTEVESQVWNATLHDSSGIDYYTSCTVLFFVDMKKSEEETYYMYYDPLVSTPPSYTDRITVIGRNNAAITDDNPMPSLIYANGSIASGIDSFDIIVNGDAAGPQATVCLVDTERGASDWGGPSCSIIRAEHNNQNALDLVTDYWMSIGEMALDAIGYDALNNVPNGFSGEYRVNVGPDNPAEAWDGQGRVEVLDDGPLFTRIKIQTTDGAYADISTTDWYRDNMGIPSNDDDSVLRGNGGNGYVKYNITYTFYYYGSSMFVNIELQIGAFPQRGSSPSYPVRLGGSYQDTNVYFKNYGDWPHLMQVVKATTGSAVQDTKSWYGTKYGLFSDPFSEDAKRRDYPLEPWMSLWDGAGSDPTIGMFATTSGIGWEVLSLAVDGIGPNALLQQILPEGHQGSQYLLPNGTILTYDYYVLTSAQATNYTSTRDMARRINDPVSVVVGIEEAFEHNSIFVHVNDISGATARNVRVQLYDPGMALINDTWVDENGNTTHIRLPDGLYTLRVLFYTPNTGREYTIATSIENLDHLTNRIVYRTFAASIANLSVHVVNWALMNETLNGAQVRILNATTDEVVEQAFVFNAPVSFRLFTTGTTEYTIQVFYGSISRLLNITNPYTLATNSELHVGVAVETTDISIQSQDTSVAFGQDYSMTFYFHKSNDVLTRFQVEDIDVSSQFDSDFWTEGIDFSWSDLGGNLVQLQLKTDYTAKLNDTGVHEAYIHVKNSTVETSVEKVFVIVEPKATDVKVLVDGIDITATGSTEINFTASFTVTVYYFTTTPLANITNDASVTMENETSSWNLVPSGNGYSITVDTDDLGPASKYSFVITCTNQSTQQQLFKYTVFPRSLATDLEVFNPAFPSLTAKDTISLNWSAITTFNLNYVDLVNNISVPLASTQVFALIGTRMFVATHVVSNNTWQFVLDTTGLPLLVGGTTLITFRATNPTYEISEFTFNCYVAPVEIVASYFINGLPENSATGIPLGDQLNITARVSSTSGAPVLGATMTVSFVNNTNALQAPVDRIATSVGNQYTVVIGLDFNTFFGKFQFFYIRIEKTNHTSIVDDVTVDVQPVYVRADIVPSEVVSGVGSFVVDPRQAFNVTIMLNETTTGLPYTAIQNVTVYVYSLYHSQRQMVYIENGVFTVALEGVGQVQPFSITVIIETPYTITRQYRFDGTITYSVTVRTVDGIPPWVFYTVFAGLIFLVFFFIAYHLRFKYPPLVRKIHDLKRSVARGRSATGIRVQKVHSREENIFQNFARNLNQYNFLQTKSSRDAAKLAGYVPTAADEEISLEFDVQPIEPTGLGFDIETTPSPGPRVPSMPSAPAPPTSPSAVGPVQVSETPTPSVVQIKRPIRAVTDLASPEKGPETAPSPVSPPTRPSLPSIAPPKPVVQRPPAPVQKPATGMPSAPPLKQVRTPVAKPVPAGTGSLGKPESVENLYQQLVLLEQKRYKAERSLRDLDGKHARGAITDSEFQEYQDKVKESLEKLKESINELRRKMISF